MQTKTATVKSEGDLRETRLLEITVLAGGPSTERDVSLAGGKSVCEALRRIGHSVVLSDIEPSDLSALDQHADFVFIVLHGEFGEDGTVQAELDRRGMPYSGCGASSSRLAMDKVDSKRRFEEAGIKTPSYVVVDRDKVRNLGSRFKTPAVVKPIAAGSSVDTNIVYKPYSMEKAAMHVSSRYGSALVETYIDGPELTVGILDNVALPVCEIRTQREFYDYQAKYLDDDTEYLFDLDLPEALLERVQTLSVKAHQLLGCEVFSRVDWRVDAKTMEPYILEINTIPGFTIHSLLPKAAGRAGLNFDVLCQRIIELSMKCHRRPSAASRFASQVRAK